MYSNLNFISLETERKQFRKNNVHFVVLIIFTDMRNNKHTIFNNKQLAKRQIGIKQNIEMTKKIYPNIYMANMAYPNGKIYVYTYVHIWLTSLPVNFIDGVTSHGTFNNQIRARNPSYFWHFAYVRQSIDVHFGAVRDSGNKTLADV